jgi:hypothetical protein
LLKQFTQTKKCNSLNFLKHTKYTFSKYGYWHFYMKSDTYLIVISFKFGRCSENGSFGSKSNLLFRCRMFETGGGWNVQKRLPAC